MWPSRRLSRRVLGAGVAGLSTNQPPGGKPLPLFGGSLALRFDGDTALYTGVEVGIEMRKRRDGTGAAVSYRGSGRTTQTNRLETGARGNPERLRAPPLQFLPPSKSRPRHIFLDFFENRLNYAISMIHNVFQGHLEVAEHIFDIIVIFDHVFDSV